MKLLDRYARLSLVSVLVTVFLITTNHTYSLDLSALGLGALLVAFSTAFLWWFRNTGTRIALAGYLAVNLWIVVGFGLLNGLWEVTLNLFLGSFLSSVSTSYPKPTIGDFWFEATGILSFVGSLFVLFFAVRLAQAKHALDSGAEPRSATPAQKAWIAAGSVLGSVAILGAYVYSAQDRWVAPTNGVVKIGVIAPTEGPYAILGGSFFRAVEVARDDLKDTRYRYELVTVDTGTDPRQAKDMIGRTIETSNLDAIVGGISLFGQVTKPYATRARVPHLCICSVTSIGDGAYNFTNIPPPEAEGERWVPEAQRRGIKSVAILSQDYPSINNHVNALKAEAARDELPIIYEERFDSATTDFRASIARARATNPDVFYIEALNPALDILGEQLVEAGITNIASVVAPSVSEKPELFEGAWYTDSDLVDFGFKERFEKKYPDEQFATHMMPYAYDSFNMIVQAYESGRNPAVYIRNITRYDGTAGLLTKKAGSGTFRSTPAVWTIKNGKPELVRIAPDM
jgi:ABC-type branched-subunit amino acid transport system substrate-binding protein